MRSFWIVLLVCLLTASSTFAELRPDSIPNVATLPLKYPSSWLFAHDVNFASLIAGKVIVVDVAADTHEYKGAVDAAQMASFIESSKRPELYVAESFYSRGTAGTRTDVVSIYNKSTLNKITEVILPNSSRAQIVANQFLMRLVGDDRFLLIYNFTPASSVSVVDMEKREVVDEIALSGCSMIYPTGRRGFSSLCGDAAFSTIQLDNQGREFSRIKGDKFFSVDDDPVFDKPVYIGDMAYFISYKSMVYPVDMSGDVPQVNEPWSLVDAAMAEQNMDGGGFMKWLGSLFSETPPKHDWRPSGWKIGATDGHSDLYVIMSKDSWNGSHKNGGEEIWVMDVETKSLKRRIEVGDNAFSIEVVTGKTPLLAVTNVNMLLDVYSLNGELQRTFSLGDASMPLMLHAQR